MKLERSLPFSTVYLAAGLLGAALSSTTDAFVYNSPAGGGGGGPRLVVPRTESSQLFSLCDSTFEASPRSGKIRDRQRQHAEEAFRELQRELEGINEKRTSTGGGPQQPFGTGVDKEAAKKWMKKAFDLASEFNGDFTPTSKEREANDELLRKSRKWAEQLMHSTDVLSDTDTETDTESYVDKNGDKLVTETPKLENASDEETFRVSVDLPGVEKVDVDVTVEDEFLIVRGTRRRRRRLFPGVDDDEPKPATVTRKYQKKIAFVESEVDIDQMEATFENGVLVISAPKKKDDPPPNEPKRRIPIV